MKYNYSIRLRIQFYIQTAQGNDKTEASLKQSILTAISYFNHEWK